MCNIDQSGLGTKKIVNIARAQLYFLYKYTYCGSLYSATVQTIKIPFLLLYPSHHCSFVPKLGVLLAFFCPALSLNTALSFNFLSSLTLTDFSVTDKALTVFVFLFLTTFSSFSCTDLVLLDPVAPLGVPPLTLLSSSLWRFSSMLSRSD
jgi:hypothetical protein